MYAISVTQKDGKANLLATNWDGPTECQTACQVPNGPNVAALEFWGSDKSDTFSQSFATTPGADYSLTFNFTNITDFSTLITNVADFQTPSSALW